MDLFEALYTTRAMRRVKPDAIPVDAQAKILDAAVRAPSGGNMQNWRFMLVDDDGVKSQLGPIYRDCLGRLWDTIYKEQLANARARKAACRTPPCSSRRGMRSTPPPWANTTSLPLPARFRFTILDSSARCASAADCSPSSAWRR